jgi:hypothetical protein
MTGECTCINFLMHVMAGALEYRVWEGNFCLGYGHGFGKSIQCDH